ncbi:AmmeMemoRadiSam system protein A [Treponema sp. TIM-1]|uniref:AmmeMemoRadiSam system protein A n=1 Tax=Treponema sp. TIM-1 TaxID=2898417 RepID=UPI00398025D5
MNLTITPQEREALLADARETISAALEQRPPEYKRGAELAAAIREGTSALTKPCGAFVTLHRGKELRGCIGRMIASDALEKTVRIMAGEAAFGDPRFPPLSRTEWPACTIEISALSPLEACSDPRLVRVGLHGLYLVHRGRSGVLLPQVPVEQGWDLDRYLDYICIKAGLPPHSYDEPGAQLYTFTAVVFGEEAP